MKIGMLWFDNNPKTTFEEKLRLLAEFYRKKYEKSPTLVWVHPTMMTLPEGEEELSYPPPLGLKVRSNRSVMPNHFWVGVA